MTINDQVRDEKLKYDINREAAKRSPTSSGKNHKYEYLTGEDLLPSIQQQIIEQIKFTYSPLGKAFDKQIKTIKDQWQNQIDALKIWNLKNKQNHLHHCKWHLHQNHFIIDDESLGQNEESYNKSFDEKLDEIRELSKEIDYKNLNYNFTTKASGSINFIKFKGPFSLFKEIWDWDIPLEMVEQDQEKFETEFSLIKSGNSRHKR